MSVAKNLFENIEGLSECTTVAELVAKLKPILNAMAFYCVSSDGAVLETQEEWHGTFTDRLYEALGKDRKTAKAAQSTVSRAASPEDLRTAPLTSAAAQNAPIARPKKGRRGGARAAPLPKRPAPSNIPASLQAIMDGTHPSLAEKEDD
jgi:hypothetical protein